MLEVYIVNLGKYNEGELVGTWLKLPATEREIQDAFVKIGIGRYTEHGYRHGVEVDGVFYEEYQIFDWEANGNFAIQQNFAGWGIYTLNAFVKKLKELDLDEVFVLYQKVVRGTLPLFRLVEEVVCVMNDLGLEHDFVHDDEIIEQILFEAKSGSWERIKFFLEDADVNSEWHILDGYGNLSRITVKDVEFAIQRIVDYVEEELHHLVA
ncbi:UNVERIFIED_ORG: antirestriction protein ArdA [Anoxybacillus amylolyticus]